VIGELLGHCRFVAKIGEGGMGVVYRAYDEVLHRDVAVKVVNKDARLGSSGSQHLLREARASSSRAPRSANSPESLGATKSLTGMAILTTYFSRTPRVSSPNLSQPHHRRTQTLDQFFSA
jgi:serine/threonine protein kinase